MAAAPGRPAVFFDRDGVLCELVGYEGEQVAPRHFRDFRIVSGALELVRRARSCGAAVFVITNQPDVARGKLDVSHLAQMTSVLQKALPIDEVAVCPHDDVDRCPCRKPNPGMILDLARRWNLDLSRSVVVGDSWKDVEAGRRAGCRTILLDRTGAAVGQADIVVATLEAAVAAIEAQFRARSTGGP